ncbi:hypothetical protein [Dactylosporangium sp. CA-139066]|uniref:hypothetical protein n=1 Tax=Dactylosporangium sp. CA-139066 TaxID=3239930 RepID=UPI003D8F9147
MPEAVLDVLAGTAGGSVTRLNGFGLLDEFPDPVDANRAAVPINALSAGRLAPSAAHRAGGVGRGSDRTAVRRLG